MDQLQFNLDLVKVESAFSATEFVLERIAADFKCKGCGYTSNDDRTASMNIRDRGVVFRYIRGTRGFVNSPNVARDEVEAPVTAN